MDNKYLVATGGIVMDQFASSARRALSLAKVRLSRGNELPTSLRDYDRLSASLLETFQAGELNYLVMDETRTFLFCGEYQGVYEEPVSLTLAEHFTRLVPEDTLREHRALSHTYTADFFKTA